MTENPEQFEEMEDPALDELNEEIASLRQLVTGSLALLIVFSLCVNMFLFYLTSQESSTVDQTEKALAQQKEIVANFPLARATDIWNKMSAYSKTHPDFTPILNKYTQYGQFLAANQSAAPTGKK